VFFYESVFEAGTNYPLKLSAILDSGSTLHIFNDLSRFRNLKKDPRNEYVIAGNSEVPILAYGDVDLRVTRPNGSKGTLRLKGVAFCTDFNPNLISFDLLQKKGYCWDNKGDNNFLVRKYDTVLCTMEKRHRQRIIEYVPSGSVSSTFIASRLPHRRKSRIASRDPRPNSEGMRNYGIYV
jgi:hypothetical protein